MYQGYCAANQGKEKWEPSVRFDYSHQLYLFNTNNFKKPR